jgi:hypothetical protein
MTINLQFGKDMKPTKGQEEIIDWYKNGSEQYFIANYSRQCGKTRVAKYLITNSLLTEKNAYLLYLTHYNGAAGRVMGEIAHSLQTAGVKIVTNKQKQTIYNPVNNTTCLFSGVDNPTALRGYTCKGFCVLDEMAFFREKTVDGQDTYKQIIEPTLKNFKPKVLVISTPHLKQGAFYDLVQLADKEDWIRYMVHTIYDDELIDKEMIDRLKNTNTELVFNTEYLCQFSESILSAFKNYDDRFQDMVYNTSRKKWMGIDFSWTNNPKSDKTVVTIINDWGQVVQHEINGEIDDKCISIANLINEQKMLSCIYYEVNGAGGTMWNDIKKLLDRQVYAKEFKTTHTSKVPLVDRCIMSIQNKELIFDKGNLKLKDEMGTFIYQLTKNENALTYNAINGHHDDYVMSLCIANLCRVENGGDTFNVMGKSGKSFYAPKMGEKYIK